ncbi:MAG: hypothetical protein CMQ38_10905 [Gammaproteobacteria bacterium]|nr:hypothetical protein [Gammaproteobacteria bacterium]
MKISTRKLFAVALAVVTFGAAGFASAHHSFAMFDRSQEVVMNNMEVVRWAFNSPHVALYARDSDGQVWAFEGAAPASLVTRAPAMNGFTFQPGDMVDIIHCPLVDGRSGGAVGIVIKDGEWYGPNDGGCGAGGHRDAWRDWVSKGYMSLAEAMEAGEEMP